jgi:hypothetical protein
VVEGAPDDLVRDVRGALVRAGVRTSASPGCGAVRASVDRRADQVFLRVKDEDGRASERQVTTASAAVTLIETWARADLGGPLLRPRSLALELPAPVEPAGVSATAIDLPRPALPFGADVLAETSRASDGSSWIGAVASACARVGHVCVGPALRWASDAGSAGGSADSPTRRRAVEAMVAARLPITFGRSTLAPGLAMGYGWLASESIPQIDSTEPEGASQNDPIHYDTSGVRAEASLAFAVAINRWVAIELRVASSLVPGAQIDGFDEAEVAAEPRVCFHGALGLRVGAP